MSDLFQQEVLESADFDDHDIIVPATLTMDPDIDVTVLGAFVIMKSFGKRADASLQTYAQRGGCSSDSFKKYQNTLKSAGWLWLLREGRPGSEPGEPGIPRLWWLAKTKGEAPPQSAFLQGGDFTAPVKTKGLKNTPPKQGLSKVLKVSRNKDLIHTPKGEVKGHPDQDEAWKGLQAAWTKKHPSAPPLAWPARTMRDWQKHLTVELERLGQVELVRRWSNMVNDPWVKASLRAFIFETDKWISARDANRPQGGRTFNQPVSDPDRRPSGGSLGD